MSTHDPTYIGAAETGYEQGHIDAVTEVRAKLIAAGVDLDLLDRADLESDYANPYTKLFDSRREYVREQVTEAFGTIPEVQVMSAEDVIARLQREHCATVDHYGRRCACGNIPRGDCPFDSPEAEGEWYEMHADHVAAVVLDTLRSNGFEVVELPEPEPDFSRYPWWDLQAAGEVVADRPDRPDEVQLIATGCLPLFFSPRSARDVAAALLAAARHAEEGTP